MKIGELAERSGLTASRIRFYEASGLLQVAERQPNGYRAYPDDALVILEIISSAQKAGFSLDEIRHLMPMDLSSWQHENLIAALHKKVQEIESMEIRLSLTKTNLLALIGDIQSTPEGLDCANNAKRVLGRMRGNMPAAFKPKSGRGGNGGKRG